MLPIKHYCRICGAEKPFEMAEHCKGVEGDETYTLPHAPHPPIQYFAKPPEYESHVAIDPFQEPMRQRFQALASNDPLTRDVELKYLAAAAIAFDIFRERHRKYSARNISTFGAPGVLVRLSDKLARLTNVYFGTGKDSPDDSISDSWFDAANYAFIGYICHSGQWPDVEGYKAPRP